MKASLAIFLASFAFIATPAFAHTQFEVGVTAMPPGITANSPKDISSHIAVATGVRFGGKLGVLVFENINPNFLSHVYVRPGAAVVYQVAKHIDLGAGFGSREVMTRSWAPTFLLGYKF